MRPRNETVRPERPRRPGRRAALAACFGACAFAAGCSSTTVTVDSALAEKNAAKLAHQQAGIRVRSVSCPDDTEAAAGVKFTCALTGRDGTTGEVQGEVTNVDGDRVDITIRPPRVLHVRVAERQLGAGLSRRVGRAVTVVCPEVVALRNGRRFTCRATTKGQTAMVRALVTDSATGRFSYTLDPSG